MKALAAAFLLVALTACEKKPSEDEIKAKVEAEVAKAKATPTPAPGDWLMKGYKNPLEQKPGKKKP